MHAPIFPRKNAGCCVAARSRAIFCTNDRSLLTESELEATMNAPVQVPVFATFIEGLRAIWAADGDNETRMEKAKPLLEQLVRDNGLKSLSAEWPSTEGGKNLL